MKPSHIALTVILVISSFVIGHVTNCGEGKEPVIDVDSSGYNVYTEDMKLVGRIEYSKCGQLDSLIDKDNE